MSENANHMRHMLFFGKHTTRVGCGCCSLKTSALLISFLGVLLSIQIMLGAMSMTWKDFEEIPIIFTAFKSFGVLAPLLMFIGALKMDFNICYVGYVMHSLYIYGLIFLAIPIGIFWGLVILPVVVVDPPYVAFFLFYFLFWSIYIGLLLSFNHIYYSFTRNLGRGQHAICSHLIYEDPFLSYIQNELLLLRLILISATLFLFIAGFRYPTVYFDVQFFNLIFIGINGYLSLKLIKKLIPPTFSSEERRLYNKYFSRYFKPNEYKKLINLARRKIYRVNSTIINQGNGFSSLFFLADVSDEGIALEMKMNGAALRNLSQFGWIGIMEYIGLISKKSLAQAVANAEYGTWGINLEVNFHIGEESEESSEASEFSEEENVIEIGESVSKISRELVIYEWDLESLNELFNDKDDGYSIKNGLHSIWLLYYSQYINKANMKITGKNESIEFKKKAGSAIYSDHEFSFIKNV